MSNKLLKSLQAQKKQTEQVKLTIYGSLGILLGGQKIVQVADRQGYVYVRLRDNQNEVIQAFNNKVAASYDLPIIVVREGSRYIVQQFNSQRYLNNAQNSAPFLPNHGTQHSFPRGGGADITWVYPQQFMPALVYPSPTTGTNVYIDRYPLYTPDNRWIYAGGTGTQNILRYLPTTGSSSLMVLVYMDAYTGNPGILVGSGTYFPAAVSGSIYQYIPSPSINQIPLAGVLLNTGTKTIQWSNIYDVRQWVHATPSGTSSGGGGGGIDTIGFVGQNKGVYLATGTTLNVNGTRVTMSVSGTTFNLTNSPDPYDNIGIYGMSGTTGIGTGTTLVVTNYLGLSATGTFLYLNPSIGTGTFQLASGNRGVTNGDAHEHNGDGWIAIADTWTRTGNHTYTVARNVTTDGNYQPGNFVSYNDGAVEYGIIKTISYSAPNSTITLITNTSYEMAAGTITAPRISKMDKPDGFPNKFNYTPTLTNLTLGNGTLVCFWYPLSRGVLGMYFDILWGSTTSIGGSPVSATFPVTTIMNTQTIEPCGILGLFDSGVGVYDGKCIILNSTSFYMATFNVATTYPSNTNVSATIPMTWTNPDRMDGTISIPW